MIHRRTSLAWLRRQGVLIQSAAVAYAVKDKWYRRAVKESCSGALGIGVIISELECDGKNKLKQLQFLVCEIFPGAAFGGFAVFADVVPCSIICQGDDIFWKTMAVLRIVAGRIPDDMPQETVPHKN